MLSPCTCTEEPLLPPPPRVVPHCSRPLLLGASSTVATAVAAFDALLAVSAPRRCCSWPPCLQVCLTASAPGFCRRTQLLYAPASRAAYTESVRDVVSALSETILFEASGASEREVRRKADPAKASIERFLRDWKGSPLVSSQPSYAALVGAFGLRRSLEHVARHKTRCFAPTLTFASQTRCGSSARSMRRGVRARRSRRTCVTRCWPRYGKRTRSSAQRRCDSLL